MKRILIILLCLMMTLSGAATAEDARADLQARFGSEAVLQHGGISYRLKKRTSTTLFSVHDVDGLQLAYVLCVDDDLDRIALIQLQPQTIIAAMEGDTLAAIFARQLPPPDAQTTQAEADSIRLMDAANTLFPDPVIENHLALNAAGLDLLDGGAQPDPALSPAENLKARLKAIYRNAENASTSAQMDMFESLSAYLATDVKTGALMKIADKAKRYEVLPTLQIAGEAQIPPEETGIPTFIPDEEALISMAIEYFYEESPW